MNTRRDLEGQQLDLLRTQFTGHRIWRAVRGDGTLGDWVASLHDPMAGIHPTVICSDAESLRDALHDQAERAAAARKTRQ